MCYREFEHLNQRMSKCCNAKIVDYTQRDYTEKGNPGSATIHVCTKCGAKVKTGKWKIRNVGEKK